MATATRTTAANYLQRGPSPTGLADVLELILDKGLVVDAEHEIAKAPKKAKEDVEEAGHGLLHTLVPGR